MRRVRPARALVFTVAALGLSAAAPSVAADAVPSNPAEVKPLAVGASVPGAQVRTDSGKAVDLAEVMAGKPTLVIFYRGGWCPFCNKHMAEIAKLYPRIREMGIQVVGISPDRPEKLAGAAGGEEVGYTLLSDSKMNAARAFGLAFQVDAATVKKYKEKYGIDLEGDSGETHHQLPVPAAYVADSDGKITFAYTNPDYKTRVSPDVLMEALE